MSPALQASIEARAEILTGFLEREKEALARACLALARALHNGGTLLAYGAGRAASDAQHVAVEFMHPVVVGKRALPALRLDSPEMLGVLASGDDIAFAITQERDDPAVNRFLTEARRRGLASIALTAGPGGVEADHPFVIGADDADVVQEVQETTYHVLWELVHVFLERPELLAEQCLTCGDVAEQFRVVALRDGAATVEREGRREEVAADLVGDVSVGDILLCHAGVALERVPEQTTDFLYPFLERGEDDLEAVLRDVQASTVRKGQDVIVLRAGIDAAAIAMCAEAFHDRLVRGGRLLAFGNGGSATDAVDLAADVCAAGWPAVALNADSATVTAVANDVGFDNAFARQLIALGRERDVAVAISTSGSSASVLAGLDRAHRLGMLTCAIVGYDGGQVAALPWLDHLLVVPGQYVPRIQEAQATVYHLLVKALEERR